MFLSCLKTGSKPTNCSVYNCTDSIAAKFSYNGVDTVTDVLERGDFLCTLDIKDAYRAISIHPDNRTRQDLWGQVEFSYFYDKRLCMGLSSSPYVFLRVSNFIVKCAQIG